jgi:SEC-C motif-containing protein
MRRNKPCYCGSGLEFKKCHGKDPELMPSRTVTPELFSRLPDELKKKILREEIRKETQGEVRPQISIDFKDHKFVAVGNRLHYSKTWKTFHDFLFDYIRTCLTPEWGNAELKKPLEERHPILQWYDSVCAFQKNHIKKVGEVTSAKCTGIVGAYLSLAYDLYVLRHHSLLQNRLVDRLRNQRQFQGARYEIYVTSSFIKAGFEIEFEDESDRSSTHCEFIATHKKSKRKYSVEAKSRHRPGFLGHPGELIQAYDKIRLRIGNLINEALKKKANHARIIFIDINMPPSEGITFGKNWFKTLGATLSRIERDGVDGKPCPPAYTFFTNHPHHYVGEDEVEPSRDFLMTAVNIPSMLVNDLQKAKEQEPPIFDLWESINRHNRVPHEFE